MCAKRKTMDEQYQLVMECRSSGLTDFQWCRKNNINPGTFYNWVSRLRKKACEIPDPVKAESYAPAEAQDIVRLNIVPDSLSNHSIQTITPDISDTAEAPVVIRLRDASISLQNTVDPKLLQLILQTLGSSVC